ncbi:class D beta-lactamase [Methylococcus sp. EFPC2]|uniref:class D beta-lactamase n=1 Tax=Methylococcus sp. EFPC2 TaxID=2812648 RepID=UPI001967D543|nr:class D beta-lactamase [Methylococcus sp. EFPC2]QSA98426.1 class D beta-lactamase [Methylococcus sp. EFPC2]
MKNLFAVLILLIVNQAHALDWQNSEVIGKLFSDAGVHGTFVLYDVSADRFTGHDRFRAETRFVPASTFKIPNSLIGLSVGAVKGVDEVLPYGGKPQPIKAWEQDMGLREAIKISNVPVYQELARRIGLKRMRENVARLGYGNGEIGTVVDNFWLTGPLKISAIEQTQFLAQLARDELPFPKDAQAKVRELVQLEQGNGWILYGKTGWADTADPDIGWWVGWVLKNKHLSSFALNIDMKDKSDAPKRIELGKASLKLLGAL